MGQRLPCWPLVLGLVLLGLSALGQAQNSTAPAVAAVAATPKAAPKLAAKPNAAAKAAKAAAAAAAAAVEAANAALEAEAEGKSSPEAASPADDAAKPAATTAKAANTASEEAVVTPAEEAAVTPAKKAAASSEEASETPAKEAAATLVKVAAASSDKTSAATPADEAAATPDKETVATPAKDADDPDEAAASTPAKKAAATSAEKAADSTDVDAEAVATNVSTSAKPVKAVAPLVTTSETPVETAAEDVKEADSKNVEAEPGDDAAGANSDDKQKSKVVEAAAGAPAAVEAATTSPKRPKKAVVEVKMVKFAPAANVTGADDIEDDGACAKELKKYCDDIEQGEGKLANCISEQVAASEAPENADDVPEISDKCQEEVYQFKISRNSNINRNVPLAKACKLDAEKFCNVTWFFGYKTGQVISCLRDVRGQVSKPCKLELFKVMMDAAVDIRADPMLYEACKDDADNICKDVKHGGGRVQACLRDKRMQLSWACEEQLFRQEMENADDIRLSVRLFSKCLPDKKKFCKDVQPGLARTKDCLEDNREDLSTACKEEIDTMIERRVRDFRLDSRLRQACETEIFNMCAYFGDLDDIDTYDSSVINCLQDYSAEIKSGKCKTQVLKYVQLAAQDIRFDVPLAEACYEDRQKFCSNVPPGSARVIRCLTNSRDSLSPVCRATLFDEEVRFSENIDFQYPMKAACAKEIQRFCKDVPHGHARVIRCLQDNKSGKEFGKACQAEINAFEATTSTDYRLNYRLHKACQKEVDKLCPGLCSNNDGNVCGGKVLRCLTEKSEDITDESCKKEVFYFEKMEVSNFRNDIILAQACRDDVEKLCADVEGGEGRVHKCLRDNRKKLSAQCKKEELMLESKESSTIELNVNLLKACNAERQLFCKDVQAGQARVFRCLAENMNDADFGNTCKAQIIQKLQRRQANWKLDPPLRKACKADVMSLCANEDAQDSEEGLVYKCLIRSYASIGSGCKKELGRAVHMAFFVWTPGAIITQECDTDIETLCLAKRPNMASRPGAVGSCLAGLLETMDRSTNRRVLAEAASTAAAKAPSVVEPKKLSDKCLVLADIAEPPNMKKAFESSLSFALLKDKLETLESSTGLQTLTRDKRGEAQGVSLTGWMALLGIAALVAVVAYGCYLGYKRMRGVPEREGYTLVVKSQPK